MHYEPYRDAAVRLPDGRMLAYCEWGDSAGRPMLLFHGSPSSRLFAPSSVTTANAGVRLITVDRPGFGRSDPRPGRQIIDWANDVEQLADALGVAELDVAGHSSGGPYALACAEKLPSRVTRILLISCIAPFEAPPPAPATEGRDPNQLTPQDSGQAAAEIAKAASWLVQTPERFLDLPRPEPDTQLLQDAAVRRLYLRAIQEAVKQGIDAYAWDGVLEGRPWGLDLSAIAAPAWIFQGAQDRAVLPSEGRRLAAALPSSHYRLFPNAAHGLIVTEWKAILDDVIT